MYNEILKIGPLTVHGYGLMIAIGVLCAVFTAEYRAKKKGLDKDIVFNLSIISAICGFAGAKLLFLIVEFKDFLQDPWRLLSGSGFVLYGGIIVGVLTGIIYCKKKKINFLEYFDLVAPSIALAQGFGRIGCFLAGCCYGCETDSFIGVVFKNSISAPNFEKLVPTQLISSAGNFTIALVLILYARKSKTPGKVGLLYLAMYSVFRFVIEFYRNDFRGTIWFMSTSQFISIFIFAAAVVGFFLIKKKKEVDAK